MAQHKGAIPWNKGLHTGLVPKTAFKRGYVSFDRTGSKLTEVQKKSISDGVKKHLPSTAWIKGQHVNPETEFKKSMIPVNYKGEKAGYVSLHKWVARKLGKPQECIKCGDTSERKYEWSNISGEYRRDLSDWQRLCVPCHAAYDDYVNKGWKTRREASFL